MSDLKRDFEGRGKWWAMLPLRPEDYHDFDAEELYFLLQRWQGQLFVALIKELADTPCSAGEHRAGVFREMREWLRRAEGPK